MAQLTFLGAQGVECNVTATVQLGNSVSNKAKKKNFLKVSWEPFHTLKAQSHFTTREELQEVGQRKEIVSSNPFQFSLPPQILQITK